MDAKLSPQTLVINATTWVTPLTQTPLRTVGRARLHRENYRPGYYRMEGQGGYEFYRTTRSMAVAGLQIREGSGWKTWMVDDPLHWIGMREIVSRLPRGPLLVAGLGLGLMLHHLQTRPDISSITVVEREHDVIELISPTLPDDDRIDIVEGDYYEFITEPPSRYASVLWDLAVGEASDTIMDFMRAKALTARAFPGVPLYCFGARGTEPF